MENIIFYDSRKENKDLKEIELLIKLDTNYKITINTITHVIKEKQHNSFVSTLNPFYFIKEIKLFSWTPNTGWVLLKFNEYNIGLVYQKLNNIYKDCIYNKTNIPNLIEFNNLYNIDNINIKINDYVEFIKLWGSN